MNNMQLTKFQYFIQNFIWRFILVLVTSIFPFLIRSLMIRKWGLEYLGINGLFTSVLQVLNIAELGMGSAILYSMYKPMAEQNLTLVNALLNLYRKIYTALGIGILIVGLLLFPFIPFLIHGSVSEDVNIYVIYLLQLSNASLGYIVCAYWNVVLQANQKISIDCKIGSILTGIMYIMQLLVICNFKNYYLYIVWLPLTTIAQNTIRAIYVRRRYPLIRCKGKVDALFIKDFYKRVFAMSLSKIRTAIRSSIDSIVISANLGLIVLAQYQNYYQVMLIPILFTGIAKTAALPSFGVSVATGSKEENFHIFEIYTFAHNWLAIWFTACLLCLTQNFMCLWTGIDNVLSNSVVSLLCVYFYLHCISENALMIRETTGVWWIGKEGAVIETASNLILNIVLVRYWGVHGVLIATILTLLCINLPFEYISIFKGYFGVNVRQYLKKQIVYLLNAIFIGIVMKAVCDRFPIGSFRALLIEGLICIILPNLLLILLNFHRKEFREIIQKLTLEVF